MVSYSSSFSFLHLGDEERHESGNVFRLFLDVRFRI